MRPRDTEEEATYVNNVGIKNRLKGKHNEIISSSINWKDGGEKEKRKKDYWWGKKKSTFSSGEAGGGTFEGKVKCLRDFE